MRLPPHELCIPTREIEEQSERPPRRSETARNCSSAILTIRHHVQSARNLRHPLRDASNRHSHADDRLRHTARLITALLVRCLDHV
jgi:hypothetical protein